MERLERAFALLLLVSWRIARLMPLGRTVPDIDASVMLRTEEWQMAYILAEKPAPKKPPRLNELLRLIARQGGFLGRKTWRRAGLEDHLARPAAHHRLRGRGQIHYHPPLLEPPF